MAGPWWLVALGLIDILSAASAHAADHARFLPKEPGFPAGSYKWNNVGGPNGTEFNADVRQGADKVGEFRFSYDTYIDNVTPQPTDGGAGLAGGFAAAQGFMLKPGFSLSFAQTVIATKAGDNEWMAPNGTEFPDSLDPQGLRPARSSPEYVNTSLPPDLMGGGPGLSPRFNDFPGRVFADGDQFWRAELGLLSRSRPARRWRLGLRRCSTWTR